MKRTLRMGMMTGMMAVALLGVSVAGAAPAEAARPAAPAAKDSRADRACGAKGHPGRRFEKADKNGDGFLTKDEVGEQRWARLSVADADKDGKVSKAELQKARADGKLGKHPGRPRGKSPKSPK